MPYKNLVADPMCPYCHTFLEYDYTEYYDIDDEKATFKERFICPCCERQFWARSVFEFKGYTDIEELG